MIMENARELLTGRFSEHFQALGESLQSQGYAVSASVHMLNHFGLPQQRERAVIVAVKGAPLHTLDELWAGWRVDPKATHVRRAIFDLPEVASGETDLGDPAHSSTLLRDHSLKRIAAIPTDGGSWRDILENKRSHQYLTPVMLPAIERRRLRSMHCES